MRVTFAVNPVPHEFAEYVTLHPPGGVVTVGRVRKATRGRHRRELSGGVLGPDREHVVRVGGEPGERVEVVVDVATTVDVPFWTRRTSYPATPLSSVAADHASVAPVWVMPDATGVPGVVGGWSTGSTPVVVTRRSAEDVADSWAPLCAMTTNVYAVRHSGP